jgi:hypothetical protein
LNATHHVFTPTASGGTQTVVALHDGVRQVPLIRSHLRTEATAFARGDFSDPGGIHGQTMPGLATLERRSGRLSVRYADIPNGARIAYSSTDPAVIAALHRWFAAQVRDHGSHAAMNM